MTSLMSSQPTCKYDNTKTTGCDQSEGSRHITCTWWQWLQRVAVANQVRQAESSLEQSTQSRALRGTLWLLSVGYRSHVLC